MRTRAPTLVGRDAELRIVADALTAARSGHGGAVFFLGEGGIGKSRLGATTADLAYAAGMTILRGRGSAIGPTVPFRPFVEVLLSFLRGGGVVDVAQLGPYGPVLGRLAPDLGTAAPTLDEGSPVIVAEAVLRLTNLVGRGRGTLLLLDDLQDADAETLAVVEYLVDNLAHQPTLLVGTVRTTPSAALELTWSAAQRDACAVLELGRLAPDDVRRLVGSCLGVTPEQVPDAVADKLAGDSAGNPFLAEELLNDLIGNGRLVQEGARWLAVGDLRTKVPATLARSVARRIELIGAQGRQVLAIAAVLGRRFPLAVVRDVSGLDDRTLLSHLRAGVDAQLVAPDDQTPDWYAFQHPLTAEAILASLGPAERARLARQAADAVQVVHPGLPGEWCQLAAALRVDAAQPELAGQLFAEAGRRALGQGAVTSAVALLEKAWELVPRDDPAQWAEVLETRAYALAEAGRFDEALASARVLDDVGGGGVDPARRIALHTRIAWAAMVAGRTADGLAQVELVRRLLGSAATEEQAAQIDVVAAHLVLELPGQDRMDTAEALGRQAVKVAEEVPLPVVACQSWQLLAALVRRRDLDEATACLERARAVAARHRLPIWEIHALLRQGNDDAYRAGSLDRLAQAREQAARAGAVTVMHQAEISIAMQTVLRGDFATAETLIEQVLAPIRRLKHVESTQYVLVAKAALFGHQGQRRAMEAALAEFREWNGGASTLVPLADGLARAFCGLTEEDRPQAIADLRRAVAAEEENPTIFYLAGRSGLRLLLEALTGEASLARHAAMSASAASGLRWNRHLTLLAYAILLGRAGRPDPARAAMAEAWRTGEPYAMARHLGLRLVGEAALADGWGQPVRWLRTAEEYFHGAGMTAVASACRGLLRTAGFSVAPRRTGTERIPRAFRELGLTVREYEVLELLMDRHANRVIAERLHISPRTVEKHVANLLVKTGQSDRVSLSGYATQRLADHPG
jgi:DNA-binding CsgD family transcriptional regulator/tetratricopeptide (TPR) repeat protein